MFFNNYRPSLAALLLAVTSLSVLSACVAEESQAPGWQQEQPLADALLTNALETQTLEQTRYQQAFQFHGVARGFHSYSESVFEPGKIVALNAREGHRVNKGEVIAELYSPILAEKLEQAKASLKKAQAQLTLDQESLSRSLKLHRKKLISQQALDEAKRDFDTAKQAMMEAQAAVDLAGNEFAETSIKAKEAGIVAKIYKREGDFINPGEPVFRFESTAKQKVSFAVPEKFAVAMQRGDKHPLFIPADGREYTGTVIEKSLPTEDGVRLHNVTFEFDSLQPEIVGLRIVLRYVAESALAFKADYRAIRYDVDNQPYIIKVDNKLSHLPVSILDMQNETILIAGELSRDTRVLIGNEVSLPVNLHKF
ncbi:efflux RND transporter periplasmic adaptor subunit [Thalassomonas viridans]|uniref:Efflux RND transporter periplasmic adaptor subunit n=1 Tax=Thalassomonas viridans TaxID=137584 RepID=A0AAE9Z9F3_9GAMM|nr:efflux RND transporter periplasmic adaptor subunit [Thalassomonas viridans]WDE08559.1 efflux RND transporter periplasmic adaptor subunit [Thalassomonas viridans]